MPTPGSDASPALPGLLAHDLRWAIVRQLALGDLRAKELVALTGQAPNLVTYHLGQLRAGGLVSVRRSAADGRDSYYTLDLVVSGPRLGDLGDLQGLREPPEDRCLHVHGMLGVRSWPGQPQGGTQFHRAEVR